MAMYESMLVSIEGGGVSNANSKSPRDDSAHVFIGLGGTGCSALKTMKKMIYERLIPDDPKSEVPKYDRIAFLGVDSDKSQFTERKAYSDLDPQSECCDIGVNNIRTVLANPQLLEQREDLNWFNYRKITIDNADAGAGGVRQMGRYLLSESTGKTSNNFYIKVQKTIRGTITVAGQQVSDHTVYVHLFAGIGGGTGSGTFIDACYLIRKIFNTLGIEDRAKLYGYFYLPDVTLAADAIRNDPLKINYITDNGFAALMELDYLMGAEQINDEFKHKYSGVEIAGNNGRAVAPVDMCHLLSVTDMSGNPKADGLLFATNSMAEYILNYMMKPELTDKDKQNNAMTLVGNVNNLITMRSGMNIKRGANYLYTVLGSASAIIPYKQFSTYLASYLFKYFEPICKNEPLPKNIDDIVKAVRLFDKDISAALKDGSAPLYLNPKTYDDNSLRNVIRPDDHLVVYKPLADYINTWDSNREGVVKKNLNDLAGQITDFTSTAQNPVAYMAKIFKYLQEHYMNAEYGPHFICELIDSNRVKTLKSVIIGLKKENDSNLQKSNGSKDFREKQLIEAATKYKQRASGKRKAEYLKEIELYYENKDKIRTCGYISLLLDRIDTGLSQLRTEYYYVFKECLDTICSTFEDNRRSFESNNIPIVSNVIQLVSWHDENIREKLNEGIEQKLEDNGVDGKTAKREINIFITQLMKNFTLWKTGKEAKVTNQVADYINTSFSAILNKSMKELIADKYGINDVYKLSELIENSIIKEVLEPNSNPIFHMNSLFLAETPALPTASVFSVPYTVDAIVQAAENYKNNGINIEVRASFVKDRISMFKFHSGVPLFAYHPIGPYHDIYVHLRNAERFGKHYYETSNGKDWRKLPMPFPKSFAYTGFKWSQTEKEQNDKLENIFNRAIEINCLQLNGTEKYIIQTGDYTSSYLITPENPETAKNLLDKWEADKSKIFADNKSATCPFKTRDDLTIALDDFLRIPSIHEIAIKEVEKFDSVEKHMEIIKITTTETIQEEKMQRFFFNSLFTGFSILQSGRIELLDPYAPDTEDNIVLLTDARAEYGNALLYQAYLKFINQPEDVFSFLNDQVYNTLNNISSERIDIVKNNESRYKALISAGKAAAAKFPNRTEVIQFYKDFELELITFLNTYI